MKEYEKPTISYECIEIPDVLLFSGINNFDENLELGDGLFENV